MNVLHLSAYAGGGGAGRAVKTLVHELSKQYAGNALWSWQDEPGVNFIHKVPVKWGLSPRFFRGVDQLSSRIFANSVNRPRSLSMLNSVDFRKLDIHESTIINLHWIAQNFSSIGALKRLNNRFVWSLYDLWAINGSSFYPDDSQCGHLSVREAIRQKRAFLELPRVEIVCPSSWIADGVLRRNPRVGNRIHIIPHAVDPDQIPILDSGLCREILGIDQDRTLVLFAGHTDDAWRKGADRLASFFGNRPRGFRDVGLIILGSSGRLFEGLEAHVYDLGPLHDQVAMNLALGAANVVCVPSRQDALPLFALEALVSGTPVVVTEDCGARDLARAVDGAFSAGPDDLNSMAKALHEALGAAADPLSIRDGAVGVFGSRAVAGKYLDLYKSLDHN